jgi:hypothetical protein
MKKNTFLLPKRKIHEFCKRWNISELAVFGSALREDFTPRSDVDILVTFQAGTEWSLIDHVRMEEELSHILGRPVDLLTRRSVEQSNNWIRREAILSSAEVVYDAR